MTYLPYSPDLETPDEDEAELFAKIAETFRRTGEAVRGAEGEAKRVSHAKSTALLTGALTIVNDLPPELAQGLAALPHRFEVLVRLAQGPGETLDDKISTHRGMAIKILGLDGPHIEESPTPFNQDFVLEAGETAFINANAKDFLLNLRGGVANAPHMPDALKSAVSDMAAAANTALKAVIPGGSKILGFFGHPPKHPLSEAYFSQAPMRWGGFVGKVGVFPTKATLDSLAEMRVDNDDDFNAFRHAVQRHFAHASAEFELRVQLALNTHDMPIENAAHRWPEDQSPYRTVARLTLPAQQAWSPARASFVDDRISFQPARSLVAHRPLGQVMRARLFVYQQLVAFRREAEGIAGVEPRSLAEIP